MSTIRNEEMERTFYNYQLLKKVRLTKPFNVPYATLSLLCIAAALYQNGLIGIAYIAASWILIAWLHYVIGRSIFIVDRYTYKGRWGWRWRMPWIGYLPLPQQFISLRYITKIMLHTTSITFLVILILCPWLPLELTLLHVFWHIWLISPRWYCILTLRAADSSGLVKVNEVDFCLYKA